MLFMSHSGYAILPLHNGRAPKWLFRRMVKLAECIIDIIIGEYGQKGLLRRLSDPWFFQSLSCVLGYDWHSSGTTTVTRGALKEALDKGDLGVTVCGGKGKTSLRTPDEIVCMGEIFGLNDHTIDELIYSSRMSAKVDNSLIQDEYTLYHHCIIFDEHGDWIVIQQGINGEKGDARRYHWGLDHNGFVENPQESILCETRLNEVLNMTSDDSAQNRQTCVDMVKENPIKLKQLISKPTTEEQMRLDDWTGKRLLVMPRSVNWDAVRAAYEFQPRNYEEMIGIRGVGLGTVRGLALVAELIYGDKASWRDPVKFSFAFGGKDGVPFPVDRGSMDEVVDVLRQGIKTAELDTREELRTLKRLRGCVPNNDPRSLRTVL
jgi:hypothetical protein